jgi:hypothetical protein
MGADTVIYTRVGHTGAEELRFYGRPVFRELLGTTTAMQMLVCGVTGRILDEDDMRVFDDILTAMSSADPRLWPFKITRLGCAYGSAAIGMGATLVASQGAIFGVNRFQEIAEVLVDLQRRVAANELDDDGLLELLRQGTVGFGILYGRYDARFDALAGQATKRGRDQRSYMTTALRAVHLARTHLGVEPHVFVAIAALCLDMNMSAYQVGMLGMLPLFHDGLANAAEGALQKPIALQSLEPGNVKYVGRVRRVSQRSRDHARNETTP